MGTLFRVHEFAELAGVTVKALHHYDRLGLLKPTRSQAGYRLYAEQDLERLEQIIALKFLGVPLKQIRSVLDRTELELRNALRLQIEALEEKQRQLARTIRAVRAAEKSIEPGQTAAPVLLKRIIEAIEMQNDLEGMKKYFSEEAWVKQRPRYENGPSPEWQAIYREAGALLAEDPASDAALAMAGRWLERLESETGGDLSVLMGRTLAWDDRENWPAALKQEITDYNLEAVYKFFSKAVLAHRRKFAGDDFWIRRDPRAQASVPWYQIFLEPRIALASTPAFPKTGKAKTQWVDYLHRSTRVDPEVQARSVRASEEAQERHQAMWSTLASDARRGVGKEPGSQTGQQIAARWMDLWDGYLKGDMGVQTALRSARAAEEIFQTREVADFIGAALAWPLRPYFNNAAWAEWNERSRCLPPASLHQSARAQIALYRDSEAAMKESPEGPRAQALAARWASLVSHDAGGDKEIEAGIRNAWEHRGNWPLRLREHVASLYLLDLTTFESISSFLERAVGDWNGDGGAARPPNEK